MMCLILTRYVFHCHQYDSVQYYTHNYKTIAVSHRKRIPELGTTKVGVASLVPISYIIPHDSVIIIKDRSSKSMPLIFSQNFDNALNHLLILERNPDCVILLLLMFVFILAVVNCGSLSNPMNGNVDLSQGTEFDSSANYSCVLG